MMDMDPMSRLSDEILALQFQLEELEGVSAIRKGKWPENHPPDDVAALLNLSAELKASIVTLEDARVAHSVAKAVDADAATIEQLRAEESQFFQDRLFARSLNEDENLPAQEPLDPMEEPNPEIESTDWDLVLRAAETLALSDVSDDTIAGPSTQYAIRQRAVLEHLPGLKIQCSVCGNAFHRHSTVRLACDDIYCKPCLKAFFLRVAKDESLFPPKCHRELIDIGIIEADFSLEELTAYRCAEQEFSSTSRVYCADPVCAKFIPEARRTPDHAACEACGAETCMHCKTRAHEGGCPEDKERQALIEFGTSQGWRACYGCGEMVLRYEGCDHMTCRCSTEFCYRCGVKWKECSCDDWEPVLLNAMAQNVVDREEPLELPPALRRQRVVAMERELLEVHECPHSGKFTRIEGSSRRGQVCGICGARHWKYILSCKRCHMLACEDCRRHRV